jgi:hypothetical protein
MIFIQPETAVGKKEMKHLVFSVVKTPGIPGVVNTSGSFMKVLIPCAVEFAQPLHFVGNSV